MTRYTVATMTGLAALLWCAPVLARKADVSDDVRAPSKRTAIELDAAAAARGLRIGSTDERLGVPTFLVNERALQAGPSVSRTRPTPSVADAAARHHLRAVTDLYRLSAGDVDDAVLRRVSLPKGDSGPVVATYGRRVNGLEVFHSELNVVMDAGQALVAVSGRLAPRLASDDAHASPSAFRLSAPQAIASAFAWLTGQPLDSAALTVTGTQGEYTQYTLPGRAIPGLEMGAPPRARQVLWPTDDALVPAYYLELNVGPAGSRDADYLAFVVSARDGEVLFRHDLTADGYTYRVWADPVTKLPHDGPHGNDMTPHPTGTPDGTQGGLNVPANLVTLFNLPFSFNDPWLPPGSTSTVGNNVDAYADLGGGDGFQAGFDLRAPVTEPDTFGHVYDLSRSPDATLAQRYASVTNLFYVTNLLHDWFYDAGFNEAAGNAQANNYGRGGLENDSLRAEAQDYTRRGTSNMATPADGARPRMQHFIFDGVLETATRASGENLDLYESHGAAFGPEAFDVEALLALPPTDGDPTVDAGLRQGCTDVSGTTPYTGTPFAGRIAVIERGVCPFAFKARNAQNAGAIGVLVINTSAAAFGRMGASGIPSVDASITIPSAMLQKSDGDALRQTLSPGTNLTFRLRKTPDLDRDGALDNGLIAHEWGHMMVSRLVGNATGLSNHQGRALAEGWADFVALLLQVRNEDASKPGNSNWSGTFSIGGYTAGGGKNQGYYFGHRRVPYSTDMTKNGLTLRHLSTGAPLPANKVARDADGARNAEIHNAGEVWATMLWECYAALLNAHPFDEAQDRMKRYLVASLKATPREPTIIEARDALLAVASASDPADYQRFLAAFAKRGAGLGAQAPDRHSTDLIGVVESSRTGNTLELVSATLDDSAISCDRDGVLDAGETGYLTVTVRNVGVYDLSGITAAVASGGQSSAGVEASLPAGNTLIFGNIARGATVTARLPVRLDQAPAASGLARLGLDVSFPVSLVSGSSVAAVLVHVNHDEVANASNTDTVSTRYSPWTTTGDASWGTRSTGVLTHWHAATPAGSIDAALTSPTLRASSGQNFVVSYSHRHSFETVGNSAPYLDGGVFELSLDGGPWTDVFDFDWFSGTTTNAGYVARVDVTNPVLPDRPGFAGLSAGFPNFVPVKVNFGRQFEGRDVRFRFRVGTDAAGAAYGWDVTNIQVLGAVDATPFPALAAETYTGAGGAPACSVRPVADAGEPQVVDERDGSGALTVVTLSAAGSFDPDGDALTYEWTQLAGPTVTLSSATAREPTFTADVAEDVELVFSLIVRDTHDSSHPATTSVTVRNTNRVPVAVVRVLDDGPTTVEERSGPITLDASGSTDLDGESLSFEWVQSAGPEVTLIDPTSATPSFDPPLVTEDTPFTFRLVARDAYSTSAPAFITLTVLNVDLEPVAHAGADQDVNERTGTGELATIVLDGTASFDPDEDGAELRYEWLQLSGPEVELDGADTATPSFVADVAEDTEYAFQLVVRYQDVSSEPATTQVVVRNVNRVPVAVAQVKDGAVEVDERSGPITLDASASFDEDGETLHFQWEQRLGPAVTLDDPFSATPSFPAPEVAADTVFRFALVAHDGLDTSEPSIVSITVRHVDVPAVANAGEARSVPARSTVTLRGTAIDVDGDAIDQFEWTQVDGPSVTLAGADTAEPTFTAPDTTETITLRFALVVTSAGARSLPATVDVTVVPENRRPTVQSMANVSAPERTEVTLVATGADPDGDALTYAWTQLGGPAIDLSGADTATLSFTAPDVAVDTTLLFRVIASDGSEASEAFEVSVNVTDVPRAPVAKTVESLTAKANEVVRLNAIGSTDADGQVLTFAWEQLSGPPVTLEGADTAVATFMLPESDESDFAATFRVTVTDPDGLTSTAEVSVTETPPADGCSTSGPSSLLMPVFAALALAFRRRRLT